MRIRVDEVHYERALKYEVNAGANANKYRKEADVAFAHPEKAKSESLSNTTDSVLTLKNSIKFLRRR